MDLDSIQDHLHDVNATVRSRSVQLWTRLAEERHIPLSFIRQGLVAEIAERLTDKSVLVRKNAVHFICVFVENNPFGPNVSPHRDLQ
jgi:condensin complex subunit 1